MAELFGTTSQYTGGTYDAYTVKDQEGKEWKIMSDASIRPQKKERNNFTGGTNYHKVELVTPKLTYEEAKNSKLFGSTYSNTWKAIRPGAMKKAAMPAINDQEVWRGDEMKIRIEEEVLEGTPLQIMEQMRACSFDVFDDMDAYIRYVQENFERMTEICCPLPEGSLEDKALAVLKALDAVQALEILEVVE